MARRAKRIKTTRTFSDYKAALKAGKKCEVRKSFDMAMDFYASALSLTPESGAEETRLEILQSMARLQYHLGHMEEALVCYREVLALPQRFLPAELQAETRLRLGHILLRQGIHAEAKAACEKGLKNADDIPALEAQLHALLARVEAGARNPGEALAHCDMALKTARKKVKGVGLANTYSNCGVAYATMGDFDSAQQIFRRAHNIYKRAGDLQGVTTSLGNMAICYAVVGRQLEALDLMMKCYNHAQKKGDATTITVSAFNLATLYAEVAQYRESIEYFHKALDLSTRTGNAIMERDSHFWLGRTLMRLGDPVGAESELTKAENISKGKKDWDSQNSREMSRAMIFMLHGKHARAIKHLDIVLNNLRTVKMDCSELCKVLEEKLNLLVASSMWSGVVETAERLKEIAGRQRWKVLYTIGLVYMARGKARMPETPDKERLTLLKNSDAALRRVVLPEEFWQTKMRLGEIFQRLGRLKEAADCYREAMDVLQRINLRVPEEYHASYLGEPDKVFLREVLSSTEAELAARKPSPAVNLLEITKSINAQIGSGRLNEAVADNAVKLVNAGRGFLLLSHEHDLRVISATKTTRPSRSDMVVIKRIAREVIQTAHPFITVNACLDHRLSLFSPVRDIGLRAALCVPLMASGRVMAALYADDPQNADVFSGDSVNLLTSYAGLVAPALENACLYRENLDQRKQLAELNVKLQKKLQAREKEIEILHQSERSKSVENAVDGFAGLNGRSKVMRDLYHFIEKIADHSLPVLIQGKSGTGKELVARAIHFTGNRKNKPFFTENCAALPETLLESELFGYVKGAFTGADRNKKGLFELADEGTLFLDEVGDMSPGMQAKLLRVLQEGRLRPVGSGKEIKVNVRILAASNKDLATLVKESEFREDLFYRLNVISVTVPSLRDRREDIPLLVETLAGDIARREKTKPLQFEGGAMRRLLMYDWPGNVRELRNVIEKLYVVARGGKVDREEVEMNLSSTRLPTQQDESLMELELADADELFRKNYITAVLKRCNGKVARAARACGVTRQHFYRLMRSLGITAHTRNTTGNSKQGSG